MKSRLMKANDKVINGSADGRTGGRELELKAKKKGASESNATKGYIYTRCIPVDRYAPILV